MAGGITFSAVAQRYLRTLKKLESAGGKIVTEWEKEAEDILSRVKG